MEFLFHLLRVLDHLPFDVKRRQRIVELNNEGRKTATCQQSTTSPTKHFFQEWKRDTH